MYKVHEDHEGYGDDLQALTTTLHVIVSVWMPLRALTLKTSSFLGHSRPILQTVTAALHELERHANWTNRTFKTN